MPLGESQGAFFLLRFGMPDIYTPPSGPPQGPLPSREIFVAMGETNIFEMARVFYSELEKSEIRAKFPKDMAEASKKLAMFLVPAMGGPPLYQQAYGPPRMRARHLPFVIGPKDREIWLACFNKVLDTAVDEFKFPSQHLAEFRAWLDGFSAWMVNSHE
jgi:hemoglobin